MPDPVLRIGQRIRVASATGWQEGNAVALTADTLWLSRSDTMPPLAVPLSSTVRIDRFAKPTAGQGARRGAWIGARLGLVGAVVWCIADQTDCRNESGRPGVGGLVVGALRWMPFLTLTGGTYGALIGLAARGPGRWLPVRRASSASGPF